jgi:hypothetical protein
VKIEVTVAMETNLRVLAAIPINLAMGLVRQAVEVTINAKENKAYKLR